MKHILLLTLFLVNPVFAVVCKTVAPDGSVSYSDVPKEKCQREIKLPEPSSYTPRRFSENAFTQAVDAKNKNKNVTNQSVSYSKIAIASPSEDAVIRDNEGKLSVSVSLSAPMADIHRLRLYIDGQQSEQDFKTLSVNLSNVNRGTHSLRAAIVGPSGSIIIESESVSFTMRKYIAKEVAKNKKSSSSKSSSSSTPGATNPAFAPSY